MVVNCCTQAVGEGSTGCTLGDVEELLGDSKEVEASFNKDEEDTLGKVVVLHRLGGKAEDNTLIMPIVEVAIVAPSVQLSHSFLLYNI